MVTWPVLLELEPVLLVIVKVTVRVAAAVYRWVTTEPEPVPPSPKSQFHWIIPVPVEVSRNVTSNGAVPLVGSEVKEAESGRVFSSD